VVPPDVGEALLRAVEGDPGLELTIDVERRTLSAAGALDIECAFPLDDATRERFIEGLDDIATTLRHAAAIDGYEARRPDWMPTAG
jgi:3-isopropylmalate/(R)-2-methylmalate dehydratase small subunit